MNTAQSGKEMTVTGVVKLELNYEDGYWQINFWVAEGLSHQVYLGRPFIFKERLEKDPKRILNREQTADPELELERIKCYNRERQQQHTKNKKKYENYKKQKK